MKHISKPHIQTEVITLTFDLNQDQPDLPKHLCLNLSIQDQDGNVLYQEQSSASARVQLKIAKDEEGRSWLYSPDISTHYWVQQADGVLQQFPYGKRGDPPLPPESIVEELELQLKMAWDEESRMWLHGTDIGTYYWEQQADGTWQQFSYVERGDPPFPPESIAEELKR